MTLREAIRSLEGDMQKAQESLDRDDILSAMYWLRSAGLTIQMVFEEAKKGNTK